MAKSVKYISYYHSPLGKMMLAAEDGALIGVWFEEQRTCEERLLKDTEQAELLIFQAVKTWLDGYFSKTVPENLPPFRLVGTDFEKAVWELLLSIPYGQTVTYGEIAAKIADRRGQTRMSAQAIGRAVGKNPIAILVPCHRVIGKDGALTGYAGGLWRKRVLLEEEGAWMADPKRSVEKKR